MNSLAQRTSNPAISNPRHDPPQPENVLTILKPFFLMPAISTIVGIA